MKAPIALASLLLALFSLDGQAGDRQRLDEHWRFTPGDPQGAAAAGFDDTAWRDVMKAVGLENGQDIGDVEFESANAPAAIRLTPDRTTINAGGQDLSFVKVEVVDAQGRLNPNADQQIDFDLAGPAAIAGLGNADLKSQDPYQGSSCHVFHGRALLVIRAGAKAGPVHLKAHAAGLKEAAVTVQTAAAN